MAANRVYRRLITVLLIAATAADASATTDLTKTVDKLGVQGANAYFSTVEGLSLSCEWGDVYITDITSDFGKTAYATLLTAKATGRKLSRIDYVQNSDTTCSLQLVEIEN